ncbi:trichohyalin-like [Zophobas morio]|uniref:trichohyalin-like n=1 Tax=Zophobas morio TaxID=2755281 RepID=UPI0030833195
MKILKISLCLAFLLGANSEKISCSYSDGSTTSLDCPDLPKHVSEFDICDDAARFGCRPKSIKPVTLGSYSDQQRPQTPENQESRYRLSTERSRSGPQDRSKSHQEFDGRTRKSAENVRRGNGKEREDDIKGERFTHFGPDSASFRREEMELQNHERAFMEETANNRIRTEKEETFPKLKEQGACGGSNSRGPLGKEENISSFAEERENNQDSRRPTDSRFDSNIRLPHRPREQTSFQNSHDKIDFPTNEKRTPRSPEMEAKRSPRSGPNSRQPSERQENVSQTGRRSPTEEKANKEDRKRQEGSSQRLGRSEDSPRKSREDTARKFIPEEQTQRFGLDGRRFSRKHDTSRKEEDIRRGKISTDEQRFGTVEDRIGHLPRNKGSRSREGIRTGLSADRRPENPRERLGRNEHERSERNDNQERVLGERPERSQKRSRFSSFQDNDG